jgi:hypothetical protein
MLLFSPIIKVSEGCLRRSISSMRAKDLNCKFYEITHPSLIAISSNPYQGMTLSK